MDLQPNSTKPTKKERTFPTLELTDQTNDCNLIVTTTTSSSSSTTPQPVLIIQSPKTPTLSRKLKAVSLDSDQTTNKKQSTSLDVVTRDVFSMPNTPKRQIKHKLSCDDDDEFNTINNEMSTTIASTSTSASSSSSTLNKQYLQSQQQLITLPPITTNLKKFASNNSISGSQTLKTLPEIMTLQDFNTEDNNRNCINNNELSSINRGGGGGTGINNKAKGLLERRGSNASLTIDLGSNSNLSILNDRSTTTNTIMPLLTRLNTAKSVSNLNLSSYGMATTSMDKCRCHINRQVITSTLATTTTTTTTSVTKSTNNERRKSQEACGNCIIYESIPTNKQNPNTKLIKNCNCNTKCRRKSLSNENLYVPPCSFCQTGSNVIYKCTGSGGGDNNDLKNCKGTRKAYYPRQPDIEINHQLLSEDFKLHIENIQYLQTAGNLLTINDLKLCCDRVPDLHQEFWAVPLNLQEKCYVSGTQNRNRYRGVLPNEHSRVHLQESQNYIHANYIKGPDYTETAYIATQGPMTHTRRDFWEMVWYTNCNCIVMLTGLIERGRNKCELYFPLGKKSNTKSFEKSFYYIKTTKERDKFTFDNNTKQQLEEEIIEYEELNEINFDNYIIRYINEEKLDECIIRNLELIKLNERRLIKHYWYPNWQDHKMANPEQVLKIALHVLDNNNQSLNHNNYSQSTSTLTTLKNNISGNNKQINNNNKVTMTTTVAPSMTTSTATQTNNSSMTSKFNNFTNIDLINNKKSTKFDKPPIIVHCSAGIGRTGCFLAILNGIKQLKNNLNVDILAILCSLRLNRGGMVQTAEQYEFIHRVLNLYIDLVLLKK